MTIRMASFLLIGLLLAACSSTPIPEAAATPTNAPVVVSTIDTSVSGAQTAVSFSAQILPIFQESCVRCHGSSSPSAGLSLESYAELMAGSRNGAVILPGDAAGSLLFSEVQSGAMPRGGRSLSDEQLLWISEWISAGAVDD